DRKALAPVSRPAARNHRRRRVEHHHIASGAFLSIENPSNQGGILGRSGSAQVFWTGGWQPQRGRIKLKLRDLAVAQLEDPRPGHSAELIEPVLSVENERAVVAEVTEDAN